jgi:hypothetical protein
LCEKIDPFFFPQTIPDTVSHRDHCHQKLKNGEASLAQNDRLLSNQQLAQRVVTLLRKRNSELQSFGEGQSRSFPRGRDKKSRPANIAE